MTITLDMEMEDTFDLSRYTNAQSNSQYESALSEIMAGRKQGHWIWYIFPQMSGLGHSEQSRYFGIRSREEAKAYYEDPILGVRLVEITNALMEHSSRPLESIVGEVDKMKIRSCMTLFQISTEDDVFSQALDLLFDGTPCSVTVQMLSER